MVWWTRALLALLFYQSLSKWTSVRATKVVVVQASPSQHDGPNAQSAPASYRRDSAYPNGPSYQPGYGAPAYQGGGSGYGGPAPSYQSPSYNAPVPAPPAKPSYGAGTIPGPSAGGYPNPGYGAAAPSSYVPAKPKGDYGGGQPSPYFGPPVPYAPTNAGYGQQYAPSGGYGSQDYSYSGGSTAGCGGGGGYGGGGGGYGGGGGGGGYGGGGGGGYGGYGGTGGYGGGAGGYGYGGGGGGCCGDGGIGDTSDPCYRKLANFIVVNAQPYERHSLVSLDDCKRFCTGSSNSSAAFQCKSLVYDNDNRICDLFAHTGNLRPAKLVPCFGKDYYEVTGNQNCGAPTTTQAPGVTGTPSQRTGSPCPGGQPARYIRVPDYQYAGGGGGGVTAPGSNVQACIDFCNTGNANGKAISCKSFDFNNGQCTFYDASPPAGPMGSGLTQSAGATHVDLVCDATAPSCRGPFERQPGMILVGYAEIVTDAASFSDCMMKCLNAQSTLGINCMSGEYYYQPVTMNNCILNMDTKTNHPELFIKEREDPVDYFELNCAGSSSSGRRFALLKSIREKARTTTEALPVLNQNLVQETESDPDPSPALLLHKPLVLTRKAETERATDAEWTEWSNCDRRKDGKRIRYRRCGKATLKECPFESEWCNLKAAEVETELGTRPPRSKKTKPVISIRPSSNSALRFRDIQSARSSSDTRYDGDCPLEACCPVLGSCILGVRRSLDGQSRWCTNPCARRR